MTAMTATTTTTAAATRVQAAARTAAAGAANCGAALCNTAAATGTWPAWVGTVMLSMHPRSPPCLLPIPPAAAREGLGPQASTSRNLRPCSAQAPTARRSRQHGQGPPLAGRLLEARQLRRVRGRAGSRWASPHLPRPCLKVRLAAQGRHLAAAGLQAGPACPRSPRCTHRVRTAARTWARHRACRAPRLAPLGTLVGRR
mmetsp:Transcript_13229/g.32336  ORF Transcript_13229/g.32336 Transcript_13229/m.32336 type:complete len:200 (-) Transcript_13229:888-1487(-)